jgi:hypothetical protein
LAVIGASSQLLSALDEANFLLIVGKDDDDDDDVIRNDASS